MFLKSILTVAVTLTMNSVFAADVITFQDAPNFYNQTKKHIAVQQRASHSLLYLLDFALFGSLNFS